MSERDPLEALAEGYREEGYDVLVRPLRQALPAFLENSDIDILARKGEQLVAVSLRHGEIPSSSAESATRFTANLDADYGRSLLAEAERLLSPDTQRAALLMGWAAFEAAARETINRETAGADKLTPDALIEGLSVRNLITDDEFEKLRECSALRSMLVHGVRPVDLPPEMLTFLLDTVRRLLRVGRTEGMIRFNEAVSATLHRSSLSRSDFIRLVEQASEAIGEILGTLRGSVSEEWNLAKDAQGQPMVTLKLSDPTGAAVATFEPSELEDRRHMVVRINRLWGDLLQIRSHAQLQRLLAS